MAEDFTDEFANADLNDVRRSRRLCKVVAAVGPIPRCQHLRGHRRLE